MRDEDVIALVVMMVIGVVALTVYIGLILLGVNIAKRKNTVPALDVVRDSSDGTADYSNRDGLPAPAQALPELWTGIEPARSSLRLLWI